MPSRKQRTKSALSAVNVAPVSTDAPPPPAAPAARTATALVTVVLALAIVHGVKFFFVPAQPRPLNRPLESLPAALVGWEESELTEEERNKIEKQFGYLGADDAITRNYVNSQTKESVSIHIAAWVSPDEWSPHPPEACYTTGGWNVKEGQRLVIGEQPSQRAQLFEATQLGAEVKVLYWYRLGDTYFKDREEARVARRALWGSREWPPLFKVIVQSSGFSLQDPQPALEAIARQIDEFTREL